MTIRMLINAMAQHELRIAIVEDGELVELDIESAEDSTLRGYVFKGVVHNVEGSLEAAFVDIGGTKQAFLPFSEISPAQYCRHVRPGEKPRITDVVKRGQEMVVQVAKDAVGVKGATLTTYLSLAGRYTVLMPNSDANGISRKIEDEKIRRKIRAIAQKLRKPPGCGFIVRTAGLGRTRLALQRDLNRLIDQWKRLEKNAKFVRAPAVLYAEPDLIGRTLRDFFTEDIDEVWIDSEAEYEAAVDYFGDVMPDYSDRLKLYKNPIPILAYYGVESQIEATFERRVPLPSGGSIVIDETEALVAIDVNSGKMTSEGGHEQTVFKTNLEAAEEIARQLKLRDLGGIIVIDFIDMEEVRHKREIEELLGEAAKDDKARYKISRINAKGLCILTRQRIRQGMRKAYQERCPVCSGTGWVRTVESHSLSLLRRLKARLAQGGVTEIHVIASHGSADCLLNNKRLELVALEDEYKCRIRVTSRTDLSPGKDEVSFWSRGELLSETTDSLATVSDDKKNNNGQRKRRRRKKRRGRDVAALSAGHDHNHDHQDKMVEVVENGTDFDPWLANDFSLYDELDEQFEHQFGVEDIEPAGDERSRKRRRRRKRRTDAHGLDYDMMELSDSIDSEGASQQDRSRPNDQRNHYRGENDSRESHALGTLPLFDDYRVRSQGLDYEDVSHPREVKGEQLSAQLTPGAAFDPLGSTEIKASSSSDETAHMTAETQLGGKMDLMRAIEMANAVMAAPSDVSLMDVIGGTSHDSAESHRQHGSQPAVDAEELPQVAQHLRKVDDELGHLSPLGSEANEGHGDTTLGEEFADENVTMSTSDPDEGAYGDSRSIVRRKRRRGKRKSDSKTEPTLNGNSSANLHFEGATYTEEEAEAPASTTLVPKVDAETAKARRALLKRIFGAR